MKMLMFITFNFMCCIVIAQDKIEFNTGAVYYGEVLAYSNGQFDVRLNNTEVKQARATNIRHISFRGTADTGPDFFFGFKHINEDMVDKVIVKQVNIRKYSEWQNPPLTYWGPTQNDLEGILTMRFDFSAPAKSIKIMTRIDAWNFAVGGAMGMGAGSGSLWGSTDGERWQLLSEQPVPTAQHEGIVYDQFVPDMLIGTKSFWLQVRLRVQGAPNTSYTVAQFGRSDSNSTNYVFQLSADL